MREGGKNIRNKTPFPPNEKELSFANLAPLPESRNWKVIMQVTEWFWDLQCVNGKQHVPILLSACQFWSLLCKEMWIGWRRITKLIKWLIWEKAESAGFAQPWDKKAYRRLYYHIPGFKRAPMWKMETPFLQWVTWKRERVTAASYSWEESHEIQD